MTPTYSAGSTAQQHHDNGVHNAKAWPQGVDTTQQHVKQGRTRNRWMLGELVRGLASMGMLLNDSFQSQPSAARPRTSFCARTRHGGQHRRHTGTEYKLGFNQNHKRRPVHAPLRRPPCSYTTPVPQISQKNLVCSWWRHHQGRRQWNRRPVAW